MAKKKGKGKKGKKGKAPKAVKIEVPKPENESKFTQ